MGFFLEFSDLMDVSMCVAVASVGTSLSIAEILKINSFKFRHTRDGRPVQLPGAWLQAQRSSLGAQKLWNVSGKKIGHLLLWVCSVASVGPDSLLPHGR